MSVLADDTKAWLLFVGRRALADAMGLGYEPSVEPLRPDDPALDTPARAFVSWHHERALVGCIGTLQPRLGLEATVRTYAVEAGLRDPRTPPATVQMLPRMRCEISVLTEPVPMDVVGVSAILPRLRPGEDGLVLRDGDRRAVFLPVVWESLPDPEAFVDALLRKARIDRATRGEHVIGERFVAEKFGEDDAP